MAPLTKRKHSMLGIVVETNDGPASRTRTKRQLLDQEEEDKEANKKVKTGPVFPAFNPQKVAQAAFPTLDTRLTTEQAASVLRARAEAKAAEQAIPVWDDFAGEDEENPFFNNCGNYFGPYEEPEIDLRDYDSAETAQSDQSVQTVQPVQSIQPAQAAQTLHTIQPLQQVQTVHSVQPLQQVQTIHNVQAVQQVQPVPIDQNAIQKVKHTLEKTTTADPSHQDTLAQFLRAGSQYHTTHGPWSRSWKTSYKTDPITGQLIKEEVEVPRSKLGLSVTNTVDLSSSENESPPPTPTPKSGNVRRRPSRAEYHLTRARQLRNSA